MLKLALAFMLLAPISAFSATRSTIIRTSSPTALCYHPETFDRAVECANNFGLCNVDELLSLSDELDNFQGAFYERDAVDQEKEIDDRKDLADLLLLQGELQARNDYFHKANLFAHDVQDDSLMKDRE
eukprot:415079_1